MKRSGLLTLSTLILAAGTAFAQVESDPDEPTPVEQTPTFDFIGDQYRIGIGFDTEFDIFGEAQFSFHEDYRSAWIGEGWLGREGASKRALGFLVDEVPRLLALDVLVAEPREAHRGVGVGGGPGPGRPFGVYEPACVPADLVLVAIGFSGPQASPFEASGIQLDDAGTFRTDDTMMTTREGVFAAGDAQRGASLVVWAIGEGRDAARQIDTYLTGDSELPWSLRTPQRPLGEV